MFQGDKDQDIYTVKTSNKLAKNKDYSKKSFKIFKITREWSKEYFYTA